MPAGTWRHRFAFALETSLRVIGPHRNTLKALLPVMLGTSEEGLFATKTAFSRLRVEQVFQAAVAGSNDAPMPKLATALGHLLISVTSA